MEIGEDKVDKLERYAQAKIDFKREICQNASRVDPCDDFHWKSLAVGYFLGKGFSPEEAIELSIEVW